MSSLTILFEFVCSATNTPLCHFLAVGDDFVHVFYATRICDNMNFYVTIVSEKKLKVVGHNPLVADINLRSFTINDLVYFGAIAVVYSLILSTTCAFVYAGAGSPWLGIKFGASLCCLLRFISMYKELRFRGPNGL